MCWTHRYLIPALYSIFWTWTREGHTENEDMLETDRQTCRLIYYLKDFSGDWFQFQQNEEEEEERGEEEEKVHQRGNDRLETAELVPQNVSWKVEGTSTRVADLTSLSYDVAQRVGC